MSQTILITGGAGFIGSNFIPYFIQAHPDYKIINLDLLTYAGNLDNLKQVSTNPNYTFIQGDICDSSLINTILGRKSLARVSSAPGKTITINFYDVDKKLFLCHRDIPFVIYKLHIIVHIITVYTITHTGWFFK